MSARSSPAANPSPVGKTRKTSGYTVAHNLMVNCPTNVAQNATGTNTISDNGSNPQGAENTKATAGIDAAYADIKKLTVPDATF